MYIRHVIELNMLKKIFIQLNAISLVKSNFTLENCLLYKTCKLRQNSEKCFFFSPY